ncbi:PAS domain S-box-containing protein [Krasilnikovia cinnamomea]|uniref:histidine kinase n=1 Tax=Krasilnikovia cinnamomea TaxID=349313 RepID=A0A4Q7ZQV3_9ACTN|nr:PAS domain-containing sensor histidine kinase [Krasilnikovia cinnamomea]RZU53512.1 PAS domain S-box-containing protein [Krasilnikovia cinnamomea]
MQTLRRIHAGGRDNGALGLVALLVLTMIGFAVLNILAQRQANRQITEAAELRNDALRAKFRIADLNGWQTAYALDTVSGVPNATDDAVGQRARFLASAAAFRQDLDRMAAHPLSTAQRQQLTAAEDAFNHFMELDARIVSGYRSGVPARIAASTELVTGEELLWYERAATAVEQLAGQAQAAVDAGATAARRTNYRALTMMIVIGVACLLLAAVLAVRAGRAAVATAHRKMMLATIVDQSADATFAITLDGIITAWNSGAERIYGYTTDEVIGRSVTMLLRPERARLLHLVLAELAEGNQYHLDDAPRRRKDGSEVFVSTILWPLRDTDGVIIGGAATERDVTARKQREAEEKIAEERAARAARLESLGQLAGGVAHDFNNLLAIILNSAELLADETGDQGDQAAQDLSRIRAAAERGRELTSQLLLFAKRDTREAETIDLNTVVTDATDLLSRPIGPTITLRCQLCPATVPVSANRGHLDQILLNLVINARDAMPHGGTIDIETGITGLAEGPAQPLPAGSYAQLTIRDNGTGMSAEVKDRLFEPFFTTKPEDQGTGLGLATVYGIVADAGGTITVDSTPGAGTTFRILLPLATQQPHTFPSQPRTQQPH